MGAFGYRKSEDLPRTIPIFPLSGALLLPRATLPLNIFEPRYLNMVDDALSGDRLIGMIQDLPGAPEGQPALHEVGCVGRITGFAETEDGRYLVTLTGICRFRMVREIEAGAPYRQVEALFEPFRDDLAEAALSAIDINRPRLKASLRRYVAANGFNADWSAVEEAPAEALINALATICPFEPEEKQALLEAQTLADRCSVLITLLDIDAAGGGEGGPTTLQ